MSFLDWLRRKHEDEPDADLIQDPQDKEEKAEEIHEPDDALLKDIWANREKYPWDMEAAEPFLPELRKKVDARETRREEAEERLKNPGAAAEGEDQGHPEKEAQGHSEEEVEGHPEEGAQESVAEGVVPVDAECEVYITDNQMTAFLCVFPPIGGGGEISADDILGTLKEKGITFGIDEEKVHSVAEGQRYNILFAVARGKPKTDGRDGAVVDHFPRGEDTGLKEDEHGNVDHKSLRRFHSVQAGGLICEITPPLEGVDGMDILGQVLKAVPGQAPVIPQGKNTVLNQEGTQLVAAQDGDVFFRSGVFCVENLLTITETVDNAVGNLDFNGNIRIQGDVKSGFEVDATGDIIVEGMVEGAVLKAGGDIVIAKGMNGNGQGTLEAGGQVKISFIENSHVTCHKDLHAATIINSHIVCGGSVYVNEGKGIIIGGSIEARDSVEAKRIGNQGGCENLITIGHAMKNEENLDYLRKQLKEDRNTWDKIKKNVTYLKSKETLPPNRVELLGQLQAQSALYEEKISAMAEKLERLENERPDFTRCRVRSEMIYPLTRISLDYARFTVRDTTAMCLVYYKEGELVLGTY